jgi:hypothetical protein
VAVVTVNQLSEAATSRYRPVPYFVQRSWRPGYGGTNDTKRQFLGDLLGGVDALDTILYHWSGNSGWQQADFAPTLTMAGARDWQGNASNDQGLNEVISLIDGNVTYTNTRTESDLKALRDSNAGHANARVMLVMHNHPQAMMPAGWPVQNGQSRNWPRRENWSITGAGTLASEIIARYGTMIRGFSYGQEMKEVSNTFRNGLFPGGTLVGGSSSTGVTNLSPNNLIDHIEGFNYFSRYMRTNHPTVELWAGHLDIFARDSSPTTIIDALLAGGSSLGPNADKIIDEMLYRYGRDPDSATFPTAGTFSANLLPDAFTIDVSVASSGGGTRWSNDYANQISRVALIENCCRVIYAKMQARWGFTIPIVAIESYFDWSQDDVTFSSNQQASLSTAIAMRALMGGIYEEARWEPQGGDLSGGGPPFQFQYSSFASWWNPFDPDTQTTPALPYVYRQFTQIKDLSNAFPPGTAMVTATSNDSNIMAIASATKVYILNTSATGVSTSVTATNGSVAAQTIPGYSHVVVNLATGTNPGAIIATGTGTAHQTINPHSRLILRF